MAFDGHQTTFGNSLFPPYERQASVNVGGGNNCGGTGPLQEQDTTSYVPWSHNAHDEPYDLNNYIQSSTKSRKPTDNTDCDGETDLQGLVSNILDEADSQDSFLSEGSLPTCNPVWSPKTLREELLQYFQSEVKTHHNPTFPPNHGTCNDLSKAQGQSVDIHGKDFHQQPNGIVSSQQWLFNLPNRDGNSYTLSPQKLPPGLPVPNIGNTYLSQMQQSKYDSMSADKDRGNSQPLKNFPAISDVFRPQGAMNSSCFHPYNEDHYIQSSAEPICERYVPQDINQLVSSFQSFMAGERDSLCCGDFPNMHTQTVAIDHEDSMVEQWKITSPAVSTQMTPAMQTQKQLMGKLGTVQMKRHGGVGNQAFQDLPEFSPQNTEYSQQPKSFSGSFNLPNQYQNTRTMHRENSSHPITTSMNQHPKHQIQWGQTPSMFQAQKQNEKKRTNMPGYVGEVSTRHKKQTPSQTFDRLRSTQRQKFDVENSIINAGNTQQFMPVMHPVNDPRKNTSMPINYTNFSSWPTLPSGSYVPGMGIGDMMSANESAALKPFVSGMMTRRGENPYHGVASDMRASTLINEGRPGIQMYLYLNECNDQWSCLEREQKRTEAILNKTFPGKRAAAVTKTNLKTPPNPKGVDHLILNQMREQGRVESLFNRMELPNNSHLHINSYTALNTHHMAISSVRVNWVRHKETEMSNHQQQRSHFTEDKEILPLVIALKDLAATTRKLRTALWNALQMTLPRPVKRQDHHVNREDAATERYPSPFGGYTFTF